MTVEYKLLEPTEDINNDIRVLATDFVKAIDKFWNSGGSEYYAKANYELDPVHLAALWRSRVSVIFLAMEHGEPVGVLYGLRRRPTFSNELVFQVEAFYGESQEIKTELLKELTKAFKYFPEASIYFPVFDKDEILTDSLKLVKVLKTEVYQR
jgi:hypothetical protein